MKIISITVLALGCIVASRSFAEDKLRIGVYDSRAVAVAYGASEFRKTHPSPFDVARAKAEEALAAAKTAGDQKQIAKLKADLMALRKKQAQMGFGAAPVDDILDLIKDRIPKIIQDAKVEALVSKWDSTELAKHKSADLIDITLLLVAEFEPSKKVLQSVWGLQQGKPLSSDETDDAVEKGI